MRRTLLVVTLGALWLAVTPAVGNAGHSWNGYHWSRSANPVTLPLVDSTVKVDEVLDWPGYLSAVSVDWSKSTVLDTSLTPGDTQFASRVLCLPDAGTIRACNAENPNVLWLGLATVWLDGKHITRASSQVNDTWFKTSFFRDKHAARHVLCQEVGHTLGLDHQYAATCMDDINGLKDPAYVSPNAHDYHELETIYKHLDGSGGNPPNKGGKKNQNNAGGPHQRQDGYHGEGPRHYPGHTETYISHENGTIVLRVITWAQ